MISQILVSLVILYFLYKFFYKKKDVATEFSVDASMAIIKNKWFLKYLRSNKISNEIDEKKVELYKKTLDDKYSNWMKGKRYGKLLHKLNLGRLHVIALPANVFIIHDYFGNQNYRVVRSFDEVVHFEEVYQQKDKKKTETLSFVLQLDRKFVNNWNSILVLKGYMKKEIKHLTEIEKTETDADILFEFPVSEIKRKTKILNKLGFKKEMLGLKDQYIEDVFGDSHRVTQTVLLKSNDAEVSYKVYPNTVDTTL